MRLPFLLAAPIALAVAATPATSQIPPPPPVPDPYITIVANATEAVWENGLIRVNVRVKFKGNANTVYNAGIWIWKGDTQNPPGGQDQCRMTYWQPGTYYCVTAANYNGNEVTADFHYYIVSDQNCDHWDAVINDLYAGIGSFKIRAILIDGVNAVSQVDDVMLPPFPE